MQCMHSVFAFTDYDITHFTVESEIFRVFIVGVVIHLFMQCFAVSSTLNLCCAPLCCAVEVFLAMFISVVCVYGLTAISICSI